MSSKRESSPLENDRPEPKNRTFDGLPTDTSYIHSNTDNVQAILHYMDYTRIRNRDIESRMKAATKSDD